MIDTLTLLLDVRTTGYVRSRSSILMQGKWRELDFLTGH